MQYSSHNRIIVTTARPSFSESSFSGRVNRVVALALKGEAAGVQTLFGGWKDTAENSVGLETPS
jgi:hypothetical protein